MSALKRCLFGLLLFIFLISINNSYASAAPVDYSDAPASYGLAWHNGTDLQQIPNGFVEYLGAGISADSSAPAEDADTYDDGVNWSPVTAGESFNLNITAKFDTAFDCSERVNIEAWLDYDSNGQFDADEKIVNWFDRIYGPAAISWCGADPSLVPTLIANSISVPADAVAGDTWLRVRLWWVDNGGSGSEADASPIGELDWGEVEDYKVSINSSSPTLNTPPIASVGGPYAADEGSVVSFDASASSDPDTGDSIVSYEWDLDNDGIYEISNNPTPSRAYSDNGTNNVSLKVTDTKGESAVDTAIVTVNNVAPNIESITLNKDPVIVGQPIQIQTQISDPGSDTFYYDWDFDWSVHNSNGKELINTNQNPVSWIYSQLVNGIYVALWVRDDDGGADFSFVPVTLAENIAPIADAGGPYQVNEGSSLLLDASASSDPNEPSDEIVKYEWDLNSDGLYVDAVGESPNLTWNDIDSFVDFPAITSFNLGLKVTDNGGLSSTSTAQLSIIPKIVSLISLQGPTKKVKSGQEASLSGRITDTNANGIGNVLLTLKQSVSGQWEDVSSVQSNALGEYLFRIYPSTTAQFKVVFDGNVTTLASESNVIQVSVINSKIQSQINRLQTDSVLVNKALKKHVKDIKTLKKRLSKFGKVKGVKNKIKTKIKNLNKKMVKLKNQLSQIKAKIKHLEAQLVYPLS